MCEIIKELWLFISKKSNLIKGYEEKASLEGYRSNSSSLISAIEIMDFFENGVKMRTLDNEFQKYNVKFFPFKYHNQRSTFLLVENLKGESSKELDDVNIVFLKKIL